ncbi:ferrous iron transport protein A [Mycobacterium avium subsp. hominissuis]|uniref:Ferrous iron transport protein A n=1 Tax=Mycobacterium avium subsp. hominissuis TaxID=439334 RepID=A0A2A3LDM9_MYCAV|nr:FeoA family protein [Mycobacterium avium]ATO67789.1 ferrous iron transport protein A [Mycobacterium avium subsp. hominissuis]PBJ39994.1 ferrous iron transport protein A [Mycobacterium avium subsp. hominissuis]PBJ67605.1 ferrous iron transport protein A [Mycobacterium avium subsp. hominissuis]QXD08142.1 ferrous iron transport protein A [Mycobacterium avium subsp. hominissuis]
MTIRRLGRSSTGNGSDRGRPRTLADLASGAAADVVGLDPAAPADVATRLRHLGFRAGIRVAKLRTAPLGDPALYRLLGYDTCLRCHEAAYIEIAERS